jgi:UDP-sugar transporter A1/2/3
MTCRKQVIFLLLVVQNSLLISTSKIYSSHIHGHFFQIIFFSELLKLAACYTLKTSGRILVKLFVLLIPVSLSFFVQNYLLLYSIQKIDMPVYQTIQQSKLLMTALFSIVILKKNICLEKWFYMCSIVFGMVLVVCEDALYIQREYYYILGLFGVFISSCLSSFTSVCFENILRQYDIIDTNICLSLTTLCIVAPMHHLYDNDLQCSIILFVISFLKALGGILVAYFTKQMGSVMKCIAASMSILICCVISYFISYQFSFLNICGICISTLSGLLYTLTSEKVK